jgi:hypothetical protein
MSDPNLLIVQDPWIWFVSANLDPTANEPVVDSSGISGDPNWFAPWWNQATNNFFVCTDATPSAIVWKRLVTFDIDRTYTSHSLSFSTPRVPDINRETIVIVSIHMVNTVLTNTTVTVQVDDAGNGTFNTIATVAMSGLAASTTETVTFHVPARSQYQFVQSGSGTSTIVSINELPL